MTSLLDLDLDYAPAMGRDRVHHGPVEWHQAAPELADLYLATVAEDVIDSCDAMAWLGHGEDDDVSRWEALERELLRATHDRYADDCAWCGGTGEDDEERRCPACHGSQQERGAWAPRVVVGNAVAGRQRVRCGWCEAETEERQQVCRCGVALRRPLELVEALRLSVAEPANDASGGAA